MSKCYRFEVGKKLPEKRWARKGKPESANMITITLDRPRAFDLVQQLLAQVQRSEYTGEEIYFQLLGEIQEDPEE